MLTMEREEEREGEVVRFTRSVREATATVPLIIADRAGAGGGCSPNDRPPGPSLSILARWIFHYFTYRPIIPRPAYSYGSV